MSGGQASPDDRFDVGRTLIALALLAIAGVTSVLGSLFIAARYPDRPAPRDTLFELLPHISAARYLTAIALIAGFALFIIWALRSARADIPTFIAIFALMYFLRSAIIVLTPLANAHGNGAYVFAMVQNGMFPSGHAGAVFLCFALISAEKAPVQRRVGLALAATVWTALILSHGHYSIDVVGGVLLAYFVNAEWTHGRLFNPMKRLVSAPAVAGTEGT